MEVKNLIKGTHSRSEMGMQRQKMYMLTDLEKQEVTTVMPDQKMYMTMNWKDAEAQAQKSKPEGGEGKMPAFEKTGKTETIAGHSCEHYLVGEEKDVDVCAARGMGVMGMGNFKGGMAGRMFGAQAKAHGNEEYLALAEEGFYPLKMETIEGGNRKLIMEVTKIEPQSLSDDLFTIPAGYSEMKMPKMPGM
jgi:outer membrane lipoprotein-sorting protein